MLKYKMKSITAIVAGAFSLLSCGTQQQVANTSATAPNQQSKETAAAPVTLQRAESVNTVHTNEGVQLQSAPPEHNSTNTAPAPKTIQYRVAE